MIITDIWDKMKYYGKNYPSLILHLGKSCPLGVVGVLSPYLEALLRGVGPPWREMPGTHWRRCNISELDPLNGVLQARSGPGYWVQRMEKSEVCRF